MKKILTLLVGIAVGNSLFAQSKVFKEVNDDISTETKTIFSGRSVIGYVVFSQLEKANEDSFNYKLTIMDENLNDIGVIDFREIGLTLEAISFENDILCLAYLKSSQFGKSYAKYKQVKKLASSDFVMTQYINLDGKILGSQNLPVTTSGSFYSNYAWGAKSSYSYSTRLKHGLQLKALPGKGFLLFYGDDANSKIINYDLQGKELWSTKLPESKGYYLNAVAQNIYLLLKDDNTTYGDFRYTSLDANTGKLGKIKNLQDKEGNQLRVFTFEPDPGTGNLYISGSILNNKQNKIDTRIKMQSKGINKGVFTIDIDSTAKNGMKEKYVYWSDGSLKPNINKVGYTKENKSYNIISNSYRDYNGNTYYVSESLVKKPRIGGIASSVILAPTFIVPMMQAMLGFNIYTLRNTNIYKLSQKGNYSLDRQLDMTKTHKGAGKADISYLTNYRSNYYVTNDESKNSYLVARDEKSTQIYNTEKRKIIRTVPYKKDGSSLLIGPAKEGYIMVIENNKKEKYTRLSIEKLD